MYQKKKNYINPTYKFHEKFDFLKGEIDHTS